MKSLIVKRSIVVAGNRTSVTVEEQFWSALRDIAQSQEKSLSEVVTDIKAGDPGNLSSGIRLFVLDRLIARLRGLSAFHHSTKNDGMREDERQSA